MSMHLRNIESLEENKLPSASMKNKEAAKIINLMDNKGGDWKMQSLHEKTKENKLKGTKQMNTEAELRNELSVVPDKISEWTNLSVRKKISGDGE